MLSSRIEGTQASISDLIIYEAEQLSFLDRPMDVREVHNYVVALEYGIARLKSLPMSLRFIRELHAQLMSGVRGEHGTPGRFRRTQNWIGPPGATLEESRFVPPPVSELRTTLDAFEEYLHTGKEHPPLVRLGLIHYQFEAIHPFVDGNGRVGRLLLTLLAHSWRLLPQPLLYLSAYFEQHRETYYELLLAVSRQGAWPEWLAFFLEGVRIQACDAIERVQRLEALRASYRERYQTGGSARLLQVIDHLFTRPAVSVNDLAGSLDVTYTTANRYAATLEADGILTEITGHARNRLYVANEIVKVLEASTSELEEAGAEDREV